MLQFRFRSLETVKRVCTWIGDTTKILNKKLTFGFRLTHVFQTIVKQLNMKLMKPQLLYNQIFLLTYGIITNRIS